MGAGGSKGKVNNKVGTQPTAVKIDTSTPLTHLRGLLTNCLQCRKVRSYEVSHVYDDWEIIACSICNIKGKHPEGFLVCDIKAGCGNKICQPCAVKAIQKITSSEAILKKLDEYVNNCLQCREPGLTHLYKTPQNVCNWCRQQNADIWDGYLHCNNCIFDICLPCAQQAIDARTKSEPIFKQALAALTKCEVGDCAGKGTVKPELTYFVSSGNPVTNCNNCLKMDLAYGRSGTLHCFKCNFDFCIDCVTKAVNDKHKTPINDSLYAKFR